jgi:hypothetical protein
MKNIFILLTLFITFTSFAQTKTTKLNLTSIELPASIDAPAGSSIVIEKWSNSLSVKGFATTVVIEELYGATVESLKKEVKNNTVNVLSKFLKEDANGFIYESIVMANKKEFHFDFIFTIADKSFHFYDNRPSALNEQEVVKLYEVIKTIKAN